MDVDMDAAGDLLINPSKVVEVQDHLNGWESGIEDLEGPPDGFLFVLPFLDLQSRLTVERASKSLREAVRDNPLVWQYLHVERPASRNLTDGILLSLVRRADGHLKILSLTQCLRTTEAALEEVLDLNPGLEKLSVPGCTGIRAEALVKLVETQSLKARARGLPGITNVQIRGLYNITREHLDCLQSVLQAASRKQDPSNQVLSPQYYGNGAADRGGHDARPIDVGVCPLCSHVRVVYDCTKHWINYNLQSPCQGCTFCIPRCEECGCCIRKISYDESLCSDLVCSTCWFGLPKCSQCNRAVCGRHAHQYMRGNGNTFTCGICILAAENPEFTFAGEI